MVNMMDYPQFLFDDFISDGARWILATYFADRIPEEATLYDYEWRTRTEYIERISLDTDLHNNLATLMAGFDELETRGYLFVLRDLEEITVLVNYGKLRYRHRDWLTDYMHGQTYESVCMAIKRQEEGASR